MGTEPRVSVVIAVKNTEKFIVATLESIKVQTYSDFEVIVVDDGSTDNTRSLVESISRDDPRFHILANGSVPGQPGALNHGIACSSGALIARCDGDDLWAPNRLERQIAFIDAWTESRPLVVIGSAAYAINEAGRIVGTFDAPCTKLEEYERLRAEGSYFTFYHSSVMFDKALCMKLGGYRSDYVGAEDLDLFTRMAESGVVLNLSERLVYYRKHGGSFSFAKTRTQAVNTLRVAENVNRRYRKLAEMSYEEFHDLMLTKWAPTTLRKFERDVRLKIWYRRGAILSVNGSYLRGAMYLTMASLLNPRLVLSGLRRSVKR